MRFQLIIKSRKMGPKQNWAKTIKLDHEQLIATFYQSLHDDHTVILDRYEQSLKPQENQIKLLTVCLVLLHIQRMDIQDSKKVIEPHCDITIYIHNVLKYRTNALQLNIWGRQMTFVHLLIRSRQIMLNQHEFP